MRQLCILFLVACAGGPAGPYNTDSGNTDGKDPTGDGGVDAPLQPVTCGGTICAAGQTCNAGACTFGCAGASVPGDYASLQTAIDAVAAVGNDATICVGNTMLNESTVYVRDTANHNKALTIIGESIDKSTLNGQLYVQSGWTKVTVKGMHLSATNRTALFSYIGNGSKLTVVASKLSGNTGLDISNPQDATVDGTEIVTTGGYGVSAYVSGGQATVKIENTYFRGTGYSVRTANSTSSGGTINLTFVGNTVIGPGIGLDLNNNTTAIVANSLFSGATTYAMQWTNTVTANRHHNALWNNATNYGGLASDGASYLKVDCMLDMTPRIPSLRSGSPCRDAGDPAVSSSHDFHGATRGSPPDLGAVEAM